MIQIKNNISLKDFNTFGIDVNAEYFVSVTTIEALYHVLKQNTNTDILVIGGGSNMLLTQDQNKLVIHLNLKGISIVEENANTVTVKVNAGENWHEFVLWCINNNYGGLENLSLIPGNVGTAPIQNIGAYGTELKDHFVSCDAVHINTLEQKQFSKTDCNFGYRNSVFKQTEKGNYIITSVTFKLSKTNHVLHTNYGAIQTELEEMGVKTPTIQDVSKAVIAIRNRKLPDPKQIGNSGSFFKNPVIPISQFEILKQHFETIPSYPVSNTTVKVPAGWLIEKAGFKGKRFGNYGVHKNQALVLVNYGNAKGSEILELSKLIQQTVQRLFGIAIEAEVNIL